MTAVDAKTRAIMETACKVASRLFRDRARAGSDKSVLAPILIIESKSGKRSVFQVQSLRDVGEKDAVDAFMRRQMGELDGARYAFVTEAWLLQHASVDDLERTNREGVRAHPDRIEIVQVNGGDIGGGQALLYRQILRPEHGKPTLGAPKWLAADEYRGRFADLLKRGS